MSDDDIDDADDTETTTDGGQEPPWPEPVDGAERLTVLLYRIVDLLQIVRDHVAHPDFHGSYSMKAVARRCAPFFDIRARARGLD